MPGRGRPFEKGNRSGGRPKIAADVRELAREHSAYAIGRLRELADGEDPRTAVAACKELLDRGVGKATQPVELGGPGGGPVAVDLLARVDLSGLSDDEVEQLVAVTGRIPGAASQPPPPEPGPAPAPRPSAGGARAPKR